MVVELDDAVGWARARPRQFFGCDHPEPVHLLAYLMADVVVLGGGECVIRREGAWWIIGSDVDWLSGSTSPVDQLFSRLVPAPGHGEHSMRGELLVGAFAVDAAVIDEAGVTVVSGEIPESAVLSRAVGLKRAITFRL